MIVTRSRVGDFVRETRATRFSAGEDERDRKRKLFSTKSNASKEKSSTLLIGTEPSEEALTTAQDFKSLLRPKKKNGFKLIKTKTKVSTEQKERRSSMLIAKTSTRHDSSRSLFRLERREAQVKGQP